MVARSIAGAARASVRVVLVVARSTRARTLSAPTRPDSAASRVAGRWSRKAFAVRTSRRAVWVRVSSVRASQTANERAPVWTQSPALSMRGRIDQRTASSRVPATRRRADAATRRAVETGSVVAALVVTALAVTAFVVTAFVVTAFVVIAFVGSMVFAADSSVPSMP